jgi:hypothetical protein
MKLNPISSEYSLTDADGAVIGVAKVDKNEHDATLELTLGDKLRFESRDEVASFLEQILSIME